MNGDMPANEDLPRSSGRRARGRVALLLACAVLGGCGDSVEPKQPDGPGVTGRMILLDDTGRPPRTSRGGGLLVIPEHSLPELWQRVGMVEPDEPDGLAHTGFRTDSELVADLGGEIVPVDNDGHFRLGQKGRHLICRLPDPATSGAAPGGASGCDLIDLPVSGALKATFGEGGFHTKLV